MIVVVAWLFGKVRGGRVHDSPCFGTGLLGNAQPFGLVLATEPSAELGPFQSVVVTGEETFYPNAITTVFPRLPPTRFSFG